jgi:hypothetical protein
MDGFAVHLEPPRKAGNAKVWIIVSLLLRLEDRRFILRADAALLHALLG